MLALTVKNDMKGGVEKDVEKDCLGADFFERKVGGIKVYFLNLQKFLIVEFLRVCLLLTL